ncbi:MAG TPA: MFS transporter [Streptosporangiaceae bacterium]|nr:MFS transporter [Streptosporangiaceae bacterium]
MTGAGGHGQEGPGDPAPESGGAAAPEMGGGPTAAGQQAQQPRATGAVRASGLAMALICGAQFVLQLDFSIVNVALPTIEVQLRMVAAELQWIVTGYALTFGSLLLVGGRLADLLGRRRLLAIGLIMFAVASLACGLAQWPVMLIVARLVQGGADALVSPAALSLLTTTNAEGAARIRALAIWQATTAGGATAGIVAGGVLTQYLGWRAVFLVNPPLILVMLALIRRLPAGAASGGSRIDYPGALLVTAAIASLIFGLSNGQQHGFAAPATVVALVLAALLGVAFVRAELRASAPMLPLSIFSAAPRRAAVAAMVMIGAVLAGYVYFISLYLQRVHHFSPVGTGLALLPSTATVVLMSTLGTRRLLSRVSVRWVLLAGLACMGGGQLWLSEMSVDATYLAIVLPGLILTSLGIGLALPTASIVITSGVRPEDQGLAGALFTTSQQTGAAIGLAVLATAAAARTAHAAGSLVAGYRLSFLIATGIIVLAAALVAVQLRPKGSPHDTELHQPLASAIPAPALAECQLRRC